MSPALFLYKEVGIWILCFNRVGSVSVSKWLAHTQGRTRANRYAHVIETADRKNADILLEVFLKKA